MLDASILSHGVVCLSFGDVNNISLSQTGVCGAEDEWGLSTARKVSVNGSHH